MHLYYIGKIVAIKANYLIFEHNFMGQVLNIADPKLFEVSEKFQKIYVYVYHTEYATKEYAFPSFKDRVLFEDLLALPGIGPRIATAILRHGADKIINYILHNDYESIAKLPYLGPKIAKQIVIQLDEKYRKIHGSSDQVANPPTAQSSYSELKNTLKVLGFKKEQIQVALDQVDDFNLPHEKLVEKSIRLIATGNPPTHA